MENRPVALLTPYLVPCEPATERPARRKRQPCRDRIVLRRARPPRASRHRASCWTGAWGSAERT